jgi:DNA-directed RNA polymerase beta' subunit
MNGNHFGVCQIRGQGKPDFWLNFQQGYSPSAPHVPMVYEKFVNNLKAAGINVVSDGTNQHIMALTNRDVKELAGDREVKSGELVDASRNFQPIAGGLFDPKIFGADGKRWGHIKLPEPVLNPVMEDPIRRTLGLTKTQLEEVIQGKAELPKFGGTGPEAIGKALGSLNLPTEIARTRADIQRKRGAGRDDAIKRLSFLMGAQKNGLHPRDWMLDSVPVLRPAFRQVGLLGDSKIPLVPDANVLYQELLDAKDNLAGLKGKTNDIGAERLALYNSFKAVTGLGDPLSRKSKEKQVQGVLGRLLGSSPKMGTLQRRLLSQSVDMVGRAVISPNPDLHMDAIQIPEAKAWPIYQNFVVRRLKRRGMPISEALRNVKDKTPLARNEMLAEMNERPVIASRAPVLHKFGVMVFRPEPTKDSALHMSPRVHAGSQ